MRESDIKGIYELPEKIPVQSQENLAAKGQFYVGGSYGQDGKGARFIYGQMYVEVYVPKRIAHPYPMIFFHGAGATGHCWMTTPDQRRGWVDLFVDKGYVVYVVDAPTRGRSAYHPVIDGPLNRLSVETMDAFLTGTSGGWPASKLHTQYPSIDVDTIARSCVTWVGYQRTEELVQKAAAELLDRTGPAILVTHSMSGTFGWLIADARPEMVKGIIALEPTGPQFAEVFSFGRTAKAREFGLTDIPMTYDPPLNPPAWVNSEKFELPDVDDVEAWLQQEPAGQWVNLVDIPVALVTSESSYHTIYDHLTVAFLKQAGLQRVDWVKLAEHGLHGNGHMIMDELNNDQVADLIGNWIGNHVE